MANARALESLIAMARVDEALLAVLLFGSAARGEAAPASDVDICLVLRPHAAEQATDKRLEYLAEFDLDLHVFQALPLPIRRRVLKEGRVLLSKDDDALYELAFRTAQAFDDFKHLYHAYLEAVLKVDRERILTKLDQLDGYLGELQQIAPASLEEYLQKIEKRRGCERLLQIAIESVIDICGLLVTGLRLGLPAEEEDLFEKLERGGVLPASLMIRLRQMRSFRNLLVRECGHIDDRLVYEAARTRLPDFDEFRRAVRETLGRRSS